MQSTTIAAQHNPAGFSGTQVANVINRVGGSAVTESFRIQVVNPLTLNPVNLGSWGTAGADITALTVDNDTTQGVHRSLSMTLREPSLTDLNPLLHAIQIWWQYYSNDGKTLFFEACIGTFLIKGFQRTLTDAVNWWQLSGLDHTVLFSQINFLNGFAIPQGTLFTIMANTMLMQDATPQSFGGRLLGKSSISAFPVNILPTEPAPTVALVAGGSLAAATWNYGYTYTTPLGQTSLSTVSANITTSGTNLSVAVSAIPALPAGTSGVNIYRRQGTGAYGLVQAQATNANWTDIGATAGVAPPAGDSYAYYVVMPGDGARFSVGAKVLFTYTTPIPAPSTAPTATITAGGVLGVYGFEYQVTFLTSAGETTAGPTTVERDISGSGQNAIALTNIPTSMFSQVIGRRIYGSQAPYGGPFATWNIVTTINDNTTTAYTDYGAWQKSNVAQPPPTTNTTPGGTETLTIAAIGGDYIAFTTTPIAAHAMGDIITTIWPDAHNPGATPAGLDDNGPNIPASRIAITPSTLSTTAPLIYDRKANKLATFNAITAAFNYWPLWFDEVAVARLQPQPYFSAALPAIGWTYHTDQNSVIIPPTQQVIDFSKLWNVVVVECEPAGGGAPFVSIKANMSQRSMISLPIYGQAQDRYVSDNAIPDQASADLRAFLELQAGALAADVVTFQTVINPLTQSHDVYDFSVTRQGVVEITSAGLPYLEEAWTIDAIARQMTHRCGHAIPV